LELSRPTYPGKVIGIELRYRMLKQTPHGNSFFSDYSEVELLLLKRDLNKIGKGGKRNDSVWHNSLNVYADC